MPEGTTNGGAGAAPPTIEQRLKDAQQTADDGKKAEAVVAALAPVAQKKKQATDKYDDKRWRELSGRWSDQGAAIGGLWHDISSAYPDWVDRVGAAVCPVLGKVDAQQQVVDKLQPQGKNEATLASAKKTADDAQAELDAWFTADQKLAARLDQIDKDIADVRMVFGNPKERVTSLFAFWWKIVPAHQGMRPDDAAVVPQGPAAGATWPQCLAKPPLPQTTPYLIAPKDYPAKIEEAYAHLSAAQKALRDAGDTFKGSPDNVAAESKRLADLTTHRDQTIKDNLKKADAAAPAAAA
jgi:hypothetical protein